MRDIPKNIATTVAEKQALIKYAKLAPNDIVVEAGLSGRETTKALIKALPGYTVISLKSPIKVPGTLAIGLAFIDGHRNLATCRNDFMELDKHIMHNGYVTIHDTADISEPMVAVGVYQPTTQDGPSQLVDDIKQLDTYLVVTVVDSMTILQKVK